MNVIAVDVGTTSVRLAIISFEGEQAREANILASHKVDIGHRQDGNKFEQSSKQIWSAICDCSRESIRKSGIKVDTVKSIAFSATCSMVVVDKLNERSNDVIMWMDHRAIDQAQRITATGTQVLEQFGGVCSPEFSLAKLLWLKENEPERFDFAAGFFELPDWLVFKCIGGNAGDCPRSSCCLTCKWGYNADTRTHCELIDCLDLSKITDQIGDTVLGPGTISGKLSAISALELGLEVCLSDKENQVNQQLEIVVGTSLIDAHSGMLAMLSIPLSDYQCDNTQECRIESTFCSLAGTSSCHMLLSKSRNFTRGIWGPYKNVILDGYFLLEAGQSLTGKLIEICIESHLEGQARLNKGEHIYEIIASLNEQLNKMADSFAGYQLCVLPTFHGNRSPLANPRLRGGVYGLTASGDRNLLEYYAATVEALVYELKLINEALGSKLNTILVSGGLMKNAFFMQTLADVLKCRVVRMDLGGVDFMVMGSGLVARHAALSKSTLQPLTESSIANIKYHQLEVKDYHSRTDRAAYHERKYLCYKEFVEFSQRVDKIMLS